MISTKTRDKIMGILTVSQVTSVKRALDALESRIRSGMHNPLTDARDENFVALAGEVHDVGDESVADELMAVDSAMGVRHGRELLEIERARQRIADDEIGRCFDCEGEIGMQRLLANPVAERCIDCESRHERTYAHDSTPSM